MTSFSEKEMLQRSELLLGTEVMNSIAQARVILFGVGGVGSWCAESLVRSGIHYLTLVDSDCVSITNCNRQLLATSHTIGRPKVEAMRERLLEINPNAEIESLQMFYNAENADFFHLETYDYVIDAIDSLADKADLILHATSLPKSVKFFSSMGAALRIDPFKVRQSEFWKVEGDALARALRNRFKKQQTFPKRKFICVYSEEQPMQNQAEAIPLGEQDSIHGKARVNGSLSHITGIFGFALAGLVINDIKCNER